MKVSLITLIACCAVTSSAFAAPARLGADSGGSRVTDIPGTHPPQAQVMDIPGTHPPQAQVMDIPGTHPPQAQVTNIPGTHPPQVLAVVRFAI